MLDENNPVEQIPLQRVDKWGCPWHGLVVDGALLATVPMPTTGTHARDVSPPPADLEDWDGSAWVVARPDMPVPVTEADEAALGMEWRNYALLSGRSSNLYGKNLAPVAYQETGTFNWLALDDLGNWWHCAMAPNADWTQSGGISLAISMSKLGAFELSAGSQSFTSVLADIGQATPALPVGGSFPTDITSGQIWVSDVLETGTQLILGLRNSVVDKASSPDWMQTDWDEHYHARFRQSLGFLLLDLGFSGGSANPVLSVIADRETALGTISSGASGEVTNDWTTVECLDCTSHERVSYLTRAISSGTTGTSGWGQVDARIVAMWFEGDPLVPTPVLLTNRIEYTCSGSSNSDYNRCEDTHVYDEAVTGTYGDHLTMTFGISVASSTISSSGTQSEHAESPGPTVSASASLTATISGMPSWTDGGSSSEVLPGWLDFDTPGDVCSAPPPASTPASPPEGFDTSPDTTRFWSLKSFPGSLAPACIGPIDIDRRVIFLTPTLLTVEVGPTEYPSTIIEDGAYSAQIGSGGAHGTTGRIAQTTPGSGIPKRVYGSHNPRENATSVAVDSRIGYV